MDPDNRSLNEDDGLQQTTNGQNQDGQDGMDVADPGTLPPATDEPSKDESPDDALEPDHEELNIVEVSPLLEDNDTPAAPADDGVPGEPLPLDHPLTDTEMDKHEAYDAGTNTATGSNDHHEEEGEVEEEAL